MFYCTYEESLSPKLWVEKRSEFDSQMSVKNRVTPKKRIMDTPFIFSSELCKHR